MGLFNPSSKITIMNLIKSEFVRGLWGMSLLAVLAEFQLDAGGMGYGAD
jgi:hypothetical protein